MFSTEDTIVAVATPPGRGGIGVVRVSGPDARAISQRLITHRGEIVLEVVTAAPLADPAPLTDALARAYGKKVRLQRADRGRPARALAGAARGLFGSHGF